MSDDDVSFSVLKGLWKKTGKVLIAHVPFEDTPDPYWEHHVSFNEEKLRLWAKKLENAVFVSDEYNEGDETLTANGFLIVLKNRRQ